MRLIERQISLHTLIECSRLLTNNVGGQNAFGMAIDSRLLMLLSFGFTIFNAQKVYSTLSRRLLGTHDTMHQIDLRPNNCAWCSSEQSNLLDTPEVTEPLSYG